MTNPTETNLENLYHQELSSLSGVTFEGIISDYIDTTDQGYKSMGINHYLEDEEPIQLNKLKENSSLKNALQKALLINLDEDQVLTNFKQQLQLAFSKVKRSVREQKKETPTQAIFLEHDFEPLASILGFGNGNFPLLSKPQYIDYTSEEEEIFVCSEVLDYSSFWNDLLLFDKLVEEYEIEDVVFDSNAYQALKDAYTFKTYILINKALDDLGAEILKGIKVDKPLIIYGNEHDCEPISIYIFE